MPRLPCLITQSNKQLRTKLRITRRKGERMCQVNFSTYCNGVLLNKIAAVCRSSSYHRSFVVQQGAIKSSLLLLNKLLTLKRKNQDHTGLLTSLHGGSKFDQLVKKVGTPDVTMPHHQNRNCHIAYQ